MKTNYIMLALILGYALIIASPIRAQRPTSTVVTSNQPNLMPVPSSVQIQTGRLAITSTFSVATRDYTDDRLRGGIRRMISRLAGRTVLSLPFDLAADESAATLVVQCARAGEVVPSVDENESYSLEITDKQARLVAPTVVGALRGLETFLQLLEGDRDGFYMQGLKIQDQPRFPLRGF